MTSCIGLITPETADYSHWHQRARTLTSSKEVEPVRLNARTHTFWIYGHIASAKTSDDDFIFFDGEIYNLGKLENDLSSPKTISSYGSPVKRLAHLFDCHKEKIFALLNGQYRMIIINPRKNQMLIAQNQFRTENIYYCAINQGFIFSDRLKSIVQVLGYRPRLEPRYLSKYFAYGFVPSPHTLFSDINKLPLSSYMLYHNQEIHLQKYWNLSFNKKTSGRESLSELGKNLYQSLLQSTRKRIDPHCRNGAYLSGGLDSSAAVAAMSQYIEPRSIKTFTAIFQEKSFDESNHARTVAQHFGTDHTEVLFTAAKAKAYIKDFITRMDEPFSDDDVICGGILSKLAEKNVDDIFVGDGPDELMMGYPSLWGHTISRLYEKLPGFMDHSIQKIIKRLPVSYKYCSLDSRFKQFLAGIGYSEHIRDAAWWGPFPPKYQHWLFIQQPYPASNEAIYNDIDQILLGVNAHDLTETIITIYMNLLSERWLLKLKEVDRGTSLNFKIPFLDPEFIDFVNTVPSRYKKKSKFLLRRSMRPYLPPQIVRGNKRPFFIPLALWIKNDFEDLVREVITESTANQLGLDYRFIQTLLSQHYKGYENNAKQIWNIFILMAWYKNLKMDMT